MSEKPISPLRQRMIEDMTVRNFVREDATRLYPRTSRPSRASSAARRTRRRPRTCAASSCIRPRPACSRRRINSAVVGAALLLHCHARPAEIARHLTLVHEPRKLPRVLSARGGGAAAGGRAGPGLKYKAALSVAYGAGLRVVRGGRAEGLRHRLQAHADPGRAGQGPQGSLCHALAAAARTAARLVAHCRPQGWLFPGRDPLLPMTTRQLNRACHMAADMAGIEHLGHAAHAAAQLRHASAGAEHRRSRDPSVARTCQARHDRALHAGRHQHHPRRSRARSIGSRR